MKIKNSMLSKEVITSINNFVEKDISATAAFKIARLLKTLSAIVEDKANAEKRILEKYTEKDEEGNMVQVKDETTGEVIENMVRISDPEKFNEEMKELGEVEVDVEYEPIEVEKLGLEKIKISELMSIEFLFAI